MARLARSKPFVCFNRAVLVLSSLVLMLLTCLIALTLLEDGKGVLHEGYATQGPSQNKQYVPDMASLLTWGHGGSGVSVDPTKLRDKEHRTDSEVKCLNY
ncbi:hypothetical protein RRG08_013942 [Elysia crispata]|uniref:Uncharacterized protein n=1 Tax=Elysia crispata TaxID=231223 RepID=A0AAE1DXH9_9GAST|nr:hypothetical protein RRG08_013942 [Elysia crispata]